MANSIGIPQGTRDDALSHLEKAKGSSGHDKHVAILLHSIYKEVSNYIMKVINNASSDVSNPNP